MYCIFFHIMSSIGTQPETLPSDPEPGGGVVSGADSGADVTTDSGTSVPTVGGGVSTSVGDGVSTSSSVSTKVGRCREYLRSVAKYFQLVAVAGCAL